MCTQLNRKGGDFLKISKTSLDLAMLRACMNPKEISNKAGISYPAFARARNQEDVKPATIGRIAKALNVDPADIIEKEKGE